MTKTWFTCILVFLVSSSRVTAQYDVCIYGGTSAGVIAAYSSARLGMSVILVEPGKHLGGLSSGGLGYTDIGNKYAITGLARDFYRQIGKHYGKFEQWIFEPHVAETVFNNYLAKTGALVLYNHRIVDANTRAGYITTIKLENTGTGEPVKTISAKIFMDCSYEGDLMARAGVSYTVGREANSVYNETYNGVQLLEGHQFPAGVDPYKTPGDPSSGLLWGIATDTLQPNGTGDKKVQAYNYRICLTNNPANRIRIERPAGYDSTRYALLLRLFAKQPAKRKLNDYFIVSMMPNGKTDINNRGGFSTDMIGMNHQYPEAGYRERAEIIRQHEAYTKGLLYFYGHDARVPVELRNEMQQWGYPADEYKDNHHWSPQLYIRESRRLKGAYVMTQANCQGREKVDDGIGMAAYTMDSHNCQRIVVNGFVRNEGNVEIGGFGPYPISYRAIIPKKEECRNLFVPVCLSASHIAYGSIRMEPVFMVLAQSAAVAARQAIKNNSPVQDIDVKKVQEILRQNPLMDGSVPEILVDNDDKNIEIEGDWVRQTSEPQHGYTGNYGPSMLIAEQHTSKKIVRFIPEIRKAGNYDVYSYFPKVPKGATLTQVVLFNGTTISRKTIAGSSVLVEGQTSGEWVALGNYFLPAGKRSYVAITNESADGTVVADAVLFVPSGK